MAVSSWLPEESGCTKTLVSFYTWARLITAGLHFLSSVPHSCPPSTHQKPPPWFPTKDCFTLNFVRLNEISLIKSPPGWRPLHHRCHTLAPLLFANNHSSPWRDCLWSHLRQINFFMKNRVCGCSRDRPMLLFGFPISHQDAPLHTWWPIDVCSGRSIWVEVVQLDAKMSNFFVSCSLFCWYICFSVKVKKTMNCTVYH